MPRPKRIFLDCTATFNNHLNTGIQRVVRNLVVRGGAYCAKQNIYCVPVIFREKRFYRIDPSELLIIYGLPPPPPKGGVQRVTLGARILTVIEKITGIKGIKERPWIRALGYAAWKVKASLVYATYWTKHFIERVFWRTFGASPILRPRPDDLLVLVDSWWWLEGVAVSLLSTKRYSRIPVIAMMYDLIPITMPEVVNAGNAHAFVTTLKDLQQRADGYMTISQAVRDEFKQYLEDLKIHGKPVDYFYLGSEPDEMIKRIEHDIVRDSVKVAAERGPSFMVVSTLEPRKNHDYVLDGFEILWKNGFNINLIFIGRKGWMMEKTFERIDRLLEAGRPLSWFQDANDAELRYCYDRTKAVILPSKAEGFGLPIVEAMRLHIPAIVSDIPVFREVAQDYPFYIDLKDPHSLADVIHQVLAGKPPPPLPDGVARGPGCLRTWDESAEEFFEKVLTMYDQVMQARPPLK